MTSNRDLYIILEVDRRASVDDIKRAFRKLARRYHPDINPGDRRAEERFKRITEAYEILSDPLKREFYDVNGFYSEGVLERGGKESSWAFRFQSFGFSPSSHSDFSEIFAEARRAGSREPQRGGDLEYPISIGFEESIAGRKAAITINRLDACQSCGGTGRAAQSIDRACSGCNGSGKMRRAKGRLEFAVTCGDCGGTGRSIAACRNCGGEGRASTSMSLDVEIPPGVAPGARIRIPGKGDAGRFGGPAGDLYVVVSVAEHPFFNRVGDNIHCTIPLTVTEAALGAKLEVPSIDGPVMLRIAPGTQSGQKLRIRGRGMPSLMNPEVRGDQYVEVRVVVPRIADERSKEILRELARLNPEDPRWNLW